MAMLAQAFGDVAANLCVVLDNEYTHRGAGGVHKALL